MTNVHKDFHGCMSYGLKFLAENYGFAEVEEYLRTMARRVYAPLIESLRRRGIVAFRDHWKRIMTLEESDYELRFDDHDTLVLEVRRCPAIHHMRERGYPVYERFCESTRIVNDEICRQTGYSADLQCNQEKGACVQRFRKAATE